MKLVRSWTSSEKVRFIILEQGDNKQEDNKDKKDGNVIKEEDGVKEEN